MAAEPVREPAPAKINLSLHVTGRRADGYHLLDSLVVFADAADSITARPAPRTSLSVTGPFAAGLGGADNLVLGAARALPGPAVPAALTLEKNLPVASGIGGGSADAAATLRALERLSGREVARETMLATALTLGADVPACLESRPLRMRGIGERLDPLPALPDLALVMVNPGVAVETAAVFARLGGRFSHPPAEPPAAGAGLDAWLGWLAASGNDLQAPAIEAAPVIGAVLEALAAQPGVGLARMSGSGATCFGICRAMDEAEVAAAAIARAHPGWWVRAARPFRR
ncbi:MAG: 4-(cytidine 5'-diphospho)-2-C-methyl-D-erythritol kinase [Alphaproteobacteria bacterium]|nr:MAG: 4-(cytidine 5'-diphospho)-2-C-methyl-D-erythritol kinase [Alphaproteobacteria bacterium]